MKKPIALIIMDGYGQSNKEIGNAVLKANTPNLDKLMSRYPHTLINASGLEVGLPKGQMGNSEVGHTNIGAGRIVYQDLTRITKEIEDKTFFENKVLCEAMENAKTNSLHLMGLLSDGGVHSHKDHLKALLKMAKEKDIDKVYVHAFTDGRDTDPRSALEYITEIQDYMNELQIGEFATISGRYYAMDRDKRWERVQLAHDAMALGKGPTSDNIIEAIKKSYEENINDEFIIPTVITKNSKPVATINQNDSIIFFNFRPDRARQLTRALVCDEFVGFERPCIKTHFVCLTEYDITIKNVHIAFTPQSLTNTLGEYLSKNNKTQLRAAETEKYAHVTFFFNGGVEEKNEGEDRLLIPSPKVATYDLQPEMSANLLLERVKEQIQNDKYDFVVVNFANPDMVGHTGNIDATVKAVETVDKCVGDLVDEIIELDGIALITADHGNAEYMIDLDTNKTVTAHSTNPVPFLVVCEGCRNIELVEGGKLSDIAPTILDLMKLEKPEEMTGKSLIKK